MREGCTELLCRSSWGTVESVGNALGRGKIRVRPVNVSKAAKMREGCTELLCRSSWGTVESVGNALGGGKIRVRPVTTKTLHGASFEGGHLLPQGTGSYVSQSRQSSEDARGVHRIALSKQRGDSRIGRQCTGHDQCTEKHALQPIENVWSTGHESMFCV